MGILVRFGKQKAFLRRGEWWCANPDLEEELNRVTEDWIQKTGGPPIKDRDHERTVAQEIAGRMGGKIAKRVAPSPRRTQAIYISRRQLGFDFS